MQSRIADDQSGVIFRQHLVKRRSVRRDDRRQPYRSARIILASATEVRELESTARVRMASKGRRDNQQYAAHRAVAGNPQVRQEIESEPVELGAGGSKPI